MLSESQLIALYRAHLDEPVLSVYLNAGQTDPASKSAWHVRFREAIREVLRDAESDEQGAADFDAALSLISEALGEPVDFLEGKGWVGFATKDKLLYAEGLPVPMPDLTRWEAGIRVAPYLRALKQARPVAVAIADSRRVRVLRYEGGELIEVDDLRADADFGDLHDSKGSRRAETSTGVRGATGKDRAQALQDLETERLVEMAAKLVADVAGSEGTVVLGGVAAPVARLRKELPTQLQERTAIRTKLSFDLPTPGIRDEVEDAASRLSKARQVHLLDSMFDLALAGGAACIGRNATERSVRERRVRLIAISDTLQRAEPDAADHLVGRAFECGASAVEVPATAYPRLDEEADGVAALLHY